MRVRLTLKLAEVMEGVDLSAHNEGDVIDLPDRDANLLLRGGWAERAAAEERVTSAAHSPPAIAADRRRDDRR